MTPDEVRTAVTAATSELQVAFLAYAERVGLEITTPRYAESWRAWQWCRQQLIARGLSDEAVTARFAPLKGYAGDTYETIAQCLADP